MLQVKEIRVARLRMALTECAGVKSELARRVQKQPAQISQWLSGYRTISEDTAREFEQRLRKPPGWMDTPHLEEAPDGAPPLSAPLSHALRHQPASNSPRIKWGAGMDHELPDVFSVTIEDDSMAPRVRRGDVVRFSRDVSPRPGDGVLVRDAAGRWYFRLYRERRPGEWGAHPLNDAYQPLDAQRDGLQILAVLTGIEEQRWG